MFGLGSLIARVAAVAVIPRVVKALSALGGAKETYWTNPVEPVKETVSAPVQLPEKVLYGRSLPTAHNYRYCGNNPMGFSDPDGLQPDNPSATAWNTAVQTAFSLQTLGQVAMSTFDAYLTGEGLRSAFGVGFNLASLSGVTRNYSKKALIQGAEAADREGLSFIGRAISKHVNRPGSILYHTINGDSAALNKAGSQFVRDILDCPWTKYEVHYMARYGGNVVDAWAANGMGLRWDMTGKLIGILNPRRF